MRHLFWHTPADNKVLVQLWDKKFTKQNLLYLINTVLEKFTVHTPSSYHYINQLFLTIAKQRSIYYRAFKMFVWEKHMAEFELLNYEEKVSVSLCLKGV